LEREEIGKEPLSILKIFWKLLRLLIIVNRNAALQRKGMEIATFLLIAAGKFSLLSHWLVACIWHFSEAFLYPLGISQRLPYSLWAFLYPFSSTQRLSNSLYDNFPAAMG
jgi:hypothetical protein